MSDRLLSTRLKELESEGLVRRDVQPGPGVRVMYELTSKGDSLKPVIGRSRTGPAAGTRRSGGYQARGLPSGIRSMTRVASTRSTG